MFDTKKFIEIIKSNPGLYDNSSPGFKQVEDKQNVWEKISNDMGKKLDGEKFIFIIISKIFKNTIIYFSKCM